MQTPIRRFSLFAALVLVMTMCLLALAVPALAWWPMWGHPAMPFGGQPPSEMRGMATADSLEALWAGLDPGTTYIDKPHPGEELMLGWRYVACWYSATGPWADRVTGYLLYNWNDIERPEANATTHWGTSIVTSVDPADYWPCLPPRSTWLWTGRLQGVTFLVNTLGLHCFQEQWTGCHRNRGLRAYVTWFFTNPWEAHGQSWVARDRGHRH